MAFSLVPATGEGIWINAWNWRPTEELVRRTGIVPDETLELLEYGIGEVTAEQATRLAEFLDGYLSGLGPQDRVTLDGTVIDEPDTFEFHRDDPSRNFSATYEWLTKFRDFCRSSNGFTMS
ncbi:MAG TPA: hypothetical protein VFC19_12020 [Candidatus Limnocylindrales bacterium]|nr:hypothetical protein [Candidatus Limnocylindrales bacterium]